jgi:HptB-dependent secretion and biofilm anti anti-sigma factor
VNEEEGYVTIRVEADQFDYQYHQTFPEIYKNRPPRTRYILDFINVKYIDSSVLGMLLKFRRHNGEDFAYIKIINLNKYLTDIFTMAHFDALFNIR